MKKSLLLLPILLLLSESLFAKTQGFFEEAKTVVRVSGVDSDVQRLFESLNVESKSIGNTLQKSFAISAVGEDDAFRIECSWSIEEVSARYCTLTFYPWKFYPVDVIIRREAQSIFLQSIHPLVAEEIARKFFEPEEGLIYFQSEDGWLKIWSTQNPQGEIDQFRIRFNSN
ncbi:MAG: hypothetical protein CL676_12750 [Bdellovibrionaceae bacterium]|nr:hypothetical protein [Pseudobdellovibrionaceae bacterium]|tara:strand:+ start:3719 stop:4231 length:513 start_codon:yes stop_codon:yes gene_type:complete